MKRDWVDWVLFVVQLASLVGTAAAALLAAVTIRQAKRQAREAQEALVRERRIDFELGVLRQLAENNRKDSGVAFVVGEFATLAAMLPVGLVPLARAVAFLESTPEARARLQDPELRGVGSPVRDLLRPEIEQEILSAIDRRISERH